MAGSGDAYGSGLMEAASRPLRATLARSTRRPWTRVRGLDAVAALGLWAAFLAVSRVLVERLYDRGVDVHVGNPPGLIALLAALREVGLHGEWMLAAIVLGGAALAPAAALVATGRSGRRGDATALGGGLVLGVALHLAYGVAPLGVVVLAVALARRRIRPLLVGALGVAAVAGAFALAGFWWLDGLERARELYRGGLSPSRPYATFLVVSVAALAVAVGPATAVGLARLRDRRLWPLPGAALAAVAFADVSGLSKGETERIWLPFVPWLLVACAAIGGERARRGWLAAQVALAIGLQAAIRSPW